MSLYLDSGYVNTKFLIDLPYPFLFCVGGRGTGKTYGALKCAVEEHSGHFQLMRRTQTELDNIANETNSPFKTLNADFNFGVTVKSHKNFAGIYGKEGQTIGQMVALSTVSNIRGFDSSDIELCIYDEFIPEAHKSPIKNEHLAFLNYYETVNRNRELQGKEPLKIRCFSNANDIMNPLIVGLGLVTKLDKMRKKKQDMYIDKERGYVLVDLIQSPISQKKAQTALYKFAGDGEFTNMSLANEFNSPLSNPVARPLREYTPVFKVGELCFYKHKSNGFYYVSSTCTGTPPEFTMKDTDLKRLKLTYFWVIEKYFMRKVEFESTISEILFLRYFKISI